MHVSPCIDHEDEDGSIVTRSQMIKMPCVLWACWQQLPTQPVVRLSSWTCWFLGLSAVGNSGFEVLCGPWVSPSLNFCIEGQVQFLLHPSLGQGLWAAGASVTVTSVCTGHLSYTGQKGLSFEQLSLLFK